MRKIIIFLIIICLPITILSQSLSKTATKRTYNEARRLMFFNNYKAAFQHLLILHNSDTSNANYNYYLGLCLYNTPLKKNQSIPHLKSAALKSTSTFKEWNIKDNTAPHKAWYYLGKAYHSNYEFNKAIKAFEKYNSLTNNAENNKVLHAIQSCKNAINLVNDSIEISIENIGNIINSEWDEHTPTISADENTLIFTSRRRGSTGGLTTDDGGFFEDIYISHKINDKWTLPKSISSNINTAGHEASIGLSFDGNELLIYKDDFGIGNIYLSRKIENDWSVPVKLGANINTSANESHATISPDGQTLIFVSDRKDGYGGKDLYYSQRLPNGEWGLAINLGNTINTEFDEEGPFFHPDGYTLFFSSQGHNTMGGFDLFYSELTENGWSKPINMGYPINTPEDELFYVITMDGKRAYFSSIREDSFGGKDIYILNLLSTPEKSATVIKGTIKIQNDIEVPNDLVIIVKDMTTKRVIGKYKPNKETGLYTIILRQGKEYEFSCEAENMQFQPQTISIPHNTSFSQINRPLVLDPIGMIIQE